MLPERLVSLGEREGAENLPSHSIEAAMSFVTPGLERIVSSASTTTCGRLDECSVEPEFGPILKKQKIASLSTETAKDFGAPVVKKILKTSSNSTKICALGVYCQKWLTESTSNQIILDFEKSIKKRDDHRYLLSTFNEYYSNVATAYNLGDYPLALALIDIAEDIQQVMKSYSNYVNALYHISASESDLFEGDNIAESDALKYFITSMQRLAMCKAKYITEVEPSKNSEIKNIWKKLIQHVEFNADHRRKIAEAYVFGNKKEYKLYQDAYPDPDDCFDDSEDDPVDYIVSILSDLCNNIKYYKPEQGMLLIKAAKQFELCEEYYNNAVRENIKGNRKKARYLKKVVQASFFVARALSISGADFSKPEKSESHRSIVEHYQHFAEFYLKAMKEDSEIEDSDEAESSEVESSEE